MLVDLPSSSPPCSCSLGFSSGSPPLPGVVGWCKLLWFDDRSQSPPDICEPLENFTESSSTCKVKVYKSESKYGNLQKGQSENGSLQFTHWKKKHNMPKLLRSCKICKGPPRNQSPCEYSTLDLTGIPSELRTVQIFAVLECKSWSEAFLPQHTASHSNPKTYTIQTKKVSLDFRTLKSYYTLTIIDLWPASFPPRKHEMGKRPHPFQDLTLDGNGRPTRFAYLGSTNLKGANLWCRQSNNGRRVFNAFCMFLPIDVYKLSKLETNTWLITRFLIDNLRISEV